MYFSAQKNRNVFLKNDLMVCVSMPGIIKVLNMLDRESESQYFLWVKAIDLDNDIEPDPVRQRSSIAMVTVYILVSKGFVWGSLEHLILYVSVVKQLQ